jgi:hypothetical protein
MEYSLVQPPAKKSLSLSIVGPRHENTIILVKTHDLFNMAEYYFKKFNNEISDFIKAVDAMRKNDNLYKKI